MEQLKAAVELLITTEEPQYAQAVRELLPEVEGFFAPNAAMLVMALPYMDDAYAQRLEELTRGDRESVREHEQEKPFGVPITGGGWGGAGARISVGVTPYWRH